MMTEQTQSDVDEEEELFISGRERWHEFTRRMAADPMLDTAIFAEALQFALLKAANIVFSDLAEVTKQQVARRKREREVRARGEQERQRFREERRARTKNPKPRATAS
jgi:hypothetical protein